MQISTWRDVFVLVIMLLVALFGAPITQLFKNLLSLLFKKVVENKWAVLLSAVVAVLLALLELWLNGQIHLFALTPTTFPAFIAAVFAVAQVYYQLFNEDATALGTAGLLKPPVATLPTPATPPPTPTAPPQ